MNSDNQIEQHLARLGQRMMPSAGFVDRVMDQVQTTPAASGRRWLPITFAVAASVLLSLGCVMLVHTRQTKSADADRSVADSQSTADPHLERSAVRWQTVTQRAVTLSGDVPAHEVHQQEFERIRWVDPEHHATFERVVPRDGATFISMESY